MPARPILHRAYAAGALHVRGDGDGRTVCGIACPFDEPTEIVEYGHRITESVRQGAFSRTIRERGADRIKALAQHDHQVLPVGRAQLLREQRDGLYCELRISNTSLGDDVLALVNDGVLDGLSIGFEPIEADTSTRDVVIHTEIRLREISLVPWPAYDGARVAGVRAVEHTPHIDHARERVARLRARFQEFLP